MSYIAKMVGGMAMRDGAGNTFFFIFASNSQIKAKKMEMQK